MPVLVADQLTKYYGQALGIQDLNIEISQSEIFAIIGPNGSGKTTIIELIAGILKPSSGSIKIDGDSLEDEPLRAKSKTGLVPDDQGMLDKLTAKECIQAVGRIYGLDKQTIESRCQGLFNLFDIAERQGDLLEEFSHGMKKKVQMVAGLINNPKLLLIDEPTAGLDPESIIIFKKLITMLKDKSIAIIVTTHNLNFVQDFCDRILIIQKGQCLVTGTVQEILDSFGVLSLEEAFLSIVNSRINQREIKSVVDSIVNDN